MTEPTDDVLGMSVRDFAAATAAKTPTPGGGSVAAVVGALGTALGEMALHFTRGKKKFAAHEEVYAALDARLARARGMFEDLVADDMAAYGLYARTSKQPDGPDKGEALQIATAAAIDVPRQVAKLCLAVLHDLRALADKVNPWLATDLLAAAALAAATCRLCDYNVRVNAPQLSEAQAAADIRAASTADLQRADALRAEIEAVGGAHLD